MPRYTKAKGSLTAAFYQKKVNYNVFKSNWLAARQPGLRAHGFAPPHYGGFAFFSLFISNL